MLTPCAHSTGALFILHFLLSSAFFQSTVSCAPLYFLTCTTPAPLSQYCQCHVCALTKSLSCSACSFNTLCTCTVIVSILTSFNSSSWHHAALSMELLALEMLLLTRLRRDILHRQMNLPQIFSPQFSHMVLGLWGTATQMTYTRYVLFWPI